MTGKILEGWGVFSRSYMFQKAVYLLKTLLFITLYLSL